MSYCRVALLLFVCAFFASTCPAQKAETPQPKQAVATVGGQTIYDQDLAPSIPPLHEFYSLPPLLSCSLRATATTSCRGLKRTDCATSQFFHPEMTTGLPDINPR